MTSVTSLDQDMRNLRLSRYTPQAANEARAWIESSLGETLRSGDILDALKDGVALCKLANLAVQGQAGSIKFKASPMPFIQMENISHFLRACELAPLSLPAHDRFLTVDLFEQKDPAQVLQCLSSFSRQAHKINPSRFATVIGPKKATGTLSPSATGGGGGLPKGSNFRRAASPAKPSAAMPSSNRTISPSLTGGSTDSQKANGTSAQSPPGPVSSWSKRSDEGSTAPAWNIHQYGYMGGASQGNQGISFGARRQITSQTPAVPSLAEKERVRKEKEAEADRARQQQTEEQNRRRRAAEEMEDNVRVEEERRWEEETRKQREADRQHLEAQKREWEEQEKRWNIEEEARRKEDAALQATLSKKADPGKPRVPSSSILRGQTLAEYQREQTATSHHTEPIETPEQRRVRELERQLEEARERERQYQAEREERLKQGPAERSQISTPDITRPESAHESEVSWAGDEREYLRQQWQNGRNIPESKPAQVDAQRPLPPQPPSLPQRLPSEPASTIPPAEPETPALPTRLQPSPSPFARPLPTPKKDIEPPEPAQRMANRTDNFLSTNTAPSQPAPRISASQEAGDTSLEQSQLRDTRIASQQKTKAGGWASKSLLEREMERERERQREWEQNQQTLKNAPRDGTQGTGEGQSWDVNQYGWTGGDGMNKGSSVGSGINIGGRRQIIGPRPQK